MVVLNDGWSTGPYRRPCKELWCPGPEAQQRASPPDKDHAGDQEKREQMQINSCDTNSDKNTCVARLMAQGHLLSNDGTLSPSCFTLPALEKGRVEHK